MYSGIVDHSGKILSITSNNGGKKIVIETQFTDLMIGESIAIDGICLTVTEFTPGKFSADVSPETLHLTKMNDYQADHYVNLERCLRFNDRVGGHLVQGHVDGTATIISQKTHGDYVEIQFGNLPAADLRFVVHKGSIAVNGISLTINAVHEDGFSVMLIPQTLAITNLKHLALGDRVNIEYDWMLKTMLHQLNFYKDSYLHTVK